LFLTAFEDPISVFAPQFCKSMFCHHKGEFNWTVTGVQQEAQSLCGNERKEWSEELSVELKDVLQLIL
jgi:hypothetical protein